MKKLSLIQQFSVIFLLISFVGVIVFGTIVNTLLEKEIIQYAINSLSIRVKKNISVHFWDLDFSGQLGRFSHEKLRPRFDEVAVILDINKIKLWNRESEIVWARNRNLEGRQFLNNHELHAAFRGKVVSEIRSASQMKMKYGYADAVKHYLEMYVPVRLGGDEADLMVFEVYKDFDSYFDLADRYKTFVWLLTVGGAFVTYLLLSLIVWGGSRRIDRQKSELHKYVQDLRYEMEEKNRYGELLHKASDDWRVTFDSVKDVIITLDRDLAVLKLNITGKYFFGRPYEYLIQKNIFDLMEETGYEEIKLFLKHGFRKPERDEAELFEPSQNIWVSASIYPILDTGSDRAGSVLVIKDITRSKKIHEMQNAARHDWEKTFDSITDMITIHDKDFNIINANKAAREMLGLPDTDINSTIKCYKYYHGTEAPPEECLANRCYSTGEVCIGEMFEPHLNRFLEFSIVPRFDGNHKLIGSIHVARDISDKKDKEIKIEKQFRHITSLHTIDKAINSSFDLSITLGVVIDQLISQFNVDAADILVFNQHFNCLEYTVGRGFKTNLIKSSKVDLNKGLAGHAAYDMDPLIINDLSSRKLKDAPTALIEVERFNAYCAIPLVSKGKIRGVLEIFDRAAFSIKPEWIEFMTNIAAQAATAIENVVKLNELYSRCDELIVAYDSTIEAYARALDFRFRDFEGHSRRLADLTMKIARLMGVRDESLVQIHRGALLHDAGKLGVPDSILLKPGKLDDEEWKIVKTHPVIAKELMYQIEFLRPAIEIPYYHHERWDGTGYPEGLKGKEIPVSARIFAVVDVWDALSSDRTYRPAWPRDKIIGYIKSQAGSHFDPRVVENFLAILEEIQPADTEVGQGGVKKEAGTFAVTNNE